jgi:hypothetical protein
MPGTTKEALRKGSFVDQLVAAAGGLWTSDDEFLYEEELDLSSQAPGLGSCSASGFGSATVCSYVK